MPIFQYTARNDKGELVRGVLKADNQKELPRLLTLLGLFAVSWHESQTVPAAEDPSAPPHSDDPIPSKGKPTFFKSPKGLTLIGCLGFSSLVWNLYYLNTKIPFFVRSDPNSLGTQLNGIRIGTPRKDVEIFLKRGRLSQESSHTQYEVTPAILIDIDYDATGGLWSPENRVIRAPVTHVMSR